MANITTNTPPASGVKFNGPRPTVFAGAPVIVQAPAAVHRGLDRRQLAWMKALSIVQIICGAQCIIFEIALNFTPFRGTGAGIPCGIFFLIAGILGVVGAVRNRKCLLIATMVMSILSSVVLFALIGMAAAMIYTNRRLDHQYYSLTATYAFGSLLIVMAIVELIVSIWASVLCCKGVCACNTQLGPHYATLPVYYAKQSMGNQVTALPQTGVTLTPSPAFMPAGQQSVNQAYYPQQKCAAGTNSYEAGASGSPPYSS